MKKANSITVADDMLTSNKTNISENIKFLRMSAKKVRPASGSAMKGAIKCTPVNKMGTNTSPNGNSNCKIKSVMGTCFHGRRVKDANAAINKKKVMMAFKFAQQS